MAFESVKGDKSEDGTFPAMWNPTIDAKGKKRMKAEADDYVDGYYVDMKENVGKNKANVYSIKKEDGEKIQIWGSTALDGEMGKVAAGSFVRIQWLGRKLKKDAVNKDKEDLEKTDYYHDWEVFVDAEKGNALTKSTGASKATEKKETKTETKVVAEAKGPEEDSDLPF